MGNDNTIEMSYGCYNDNFDNFFLKFMELMRTFEPCESTFLSYKEACLRALEGEMYEEPINKLNGLMDECLFASPSVK